MGLSANARRYLWGADSPSPSLPLVHAASASEADGRVVVVGVTRSLPRGPAQHSSRRRGCSVGPISPSVVAPCSKPGLEARPGPCSGDKNSEWKLVLLINEPFSFLFQVSGPRGPDKKKSE